MGPITKERIAVALNRVPVVHWDRFIANHEGGFDVYGWIDRDDGRADFILIRFDQVGFWLEFWTSSAEHSHAVYELLQGEPSEGHNDCKRVDETFGDLVKKAARRSAA